MSRPHPSEPRSGGKTGPPWKGANVKLLIREDQFRGAAKKHLIQLALLVFSAGDQLSDLHRVALSCIPSTLGGMAEVENATQYFRRWARRQYLTGYEQERRRQAKAEGSRRIDVTLNAKALDDYATVLAYS